MRNQETGLEYANTDPSMRCNTVRGSRGPSWQSIWIYLMKARDEEAAQLVHDLNATHSNECHYQDHDYCHYPHCECVCHKPRESMALVPYDPDFQDFSWSTVANAEEIALNHELAALRRQAAVSLSCVREAAEAVRELTKVLEVV